MDSPSLYANAVLAMVKAMLGDDYRKDSVAEETAKDLNSLGLYNEQIVQLSQRATKDLMKEFKP